MNLPVAISNSLLPSALQISIKPALTFDGVMAFAIDGATPLNSMAKHASHMVSCRSLWKIRIDRIITKLPANEKFCFEFRESLIKEPLIKSGSLFASY